MGSVEILGSLYMKPGMKIDWYETEKKSYRLAVKFTQMFTGLEMVWNSYWGRFYIGMDFKFNTRHELLGAYL